MLQPTAMADAHELQLVLRRQHLQARSALLRDRLAQQAQPLAAPLALADTLREAWRWLKRHPEVPLAGAAVLALLRPRRALRWAGRLWWAWGLLRRVQRLAGQAPPNLKR